MADPVAVGGAVLTQLEEHWTDRPQIAVTDVSGRVELDMAGERGQRCALERVLADASLDTSGRPDHGHGHIRGLTALGKDEVSEVSDSGSCGRRSAPAT
jgi:hypothetical protein